MRLIHIMGFVCAMLVLAMVPGFLNCARLSGFQPSVLLTTSAAGVLALLAVRRPS